MKLFVTTLSLLCGALAAGPVSAQDFFYIPPGGDFGYQYGIDLGDGVGYGYSFGYGYQGKTPADAIAAANADLHQAQQNQAQQNQLHPPVYEMSDEIPYFAPKAKKAPAKQTVVNLKKKNGVKVPPAKAVAQKPIVEKKATKPANPKPQDLPPAPDQPEKLKDKQPIEKTERPADANKK